MKNDVKITQRVNCDERRMERDYSTETGMTTDLNRDFLSFIYQTK